MSHFSCCSMSVLDTLGDIRVRASSKSFMETGSSMSAFDMARISPCVRPFTFLLIPFMDASRQILVISSPEYPLVRLASSAASTLSSTCQPRTPKTQTQLPVLSCDCDTMNKQSSNQAVKQWWAVPTWSPARLMWISAVLLSSVGKGMYTRFSSLRLTPPIPSSHANVRGGRKMTRGPRNGTGPQSFVEFPRVVGGCQDHHDLHASVFPDRVVVDAVDLHQQLRLHAARGLVLSRPPANQRKQPWARVVAAAVPRCSASPSGVAQRVHFVEEDGARRVESRHVE